MQVLITCWTHAFGGSSSVYTPVGSYLDVYLRDYGDAIRRLDITACIPRTRGQLTKSEMREFGSLPRVIFRRQKKTLEIGFLSQVAVAADEETTSFSVAKCNEAMAEIAEVLSGVKSKLKANDDFDYSSFMSDAKSLLAKPFSSVEEIEEIEEAARQKYFSLRENRDPWENPGLDWDRDCYHRDSRAILDEPFFWDRGNDFAPHGSDTGSDALLLYEEWRRDRSKDESPIRLVSRIISEWGIREIDWSLVDEESAYALFRNDEIAYRVCNQLAIAIAFAELKYEAKCPQALASMAIASIRRFDFTFMHDQIHEPFKSEYAASLTLMKSILETTQS